MILEVKNLLLLYIPTLVAIACICFLVEVD